MMCVITTMITFFLSKLQCAMYLGTISDDERLMNFIISTATCVTPSGEKRAEEQDYSEKRRQQVGLLIYRTHL